MTYLPLSASSALKNPKFHFAVMELVEAMSVLFSPIAGRIEMRDGLNSVLEISMIGFVVVSCLFMVNLPI